MKSVLLIVTLSLFTLLNVKGQMNIEVPPDPFLFPFISYSQSFEKAKGIWELSEWLCESGGGAYNQIITSDGCDGLHSLKIKADIALGTGPNRVNATQSDATLKLALEENEIYHMSFSWRGTFTISKPQFYPSFNAEEFFSKNNYYNDQNAIDGIFFSDDNGRNYTQVASFSNKYDIWSDKQINISQLAKANGLTVNRNFRIKFSYYCIEGEIDYIPEHSRFLEIDNVHVSTVGASAARPYRVTFDYDRSGNRTERTIEYVKNSGLKSAQRAEEVEEAEEADENFLGEKIIQIAPNPTKGKLRVLITNGDDTERVNYTINSLAGKLIMQGKFIGNGDHPINLHKYPDGIYLLKLKDGSNTLTYKIIKE